MIANSFVMQVLTALLSLGLVFFYIQPVLTETKPVNDEIAKHQQSLESVERISGLLDKQVLAINSIPELTKRAFADYLPSTFDSVLVLRDLYLILLSHEIIPTTLRYAGSGAAIKAGNSNLEVVPHNFELSFVVTYDNLKKFLLQIERMKYPLHVYTLGLSQDEGGMVSVSLKLVTYAQK